ncbi:Tryptophan synthase alpha chain [Fundidesulfovibrio magnetotacticus]|uniref:Tryptophan synthase alpha chain n=1 Tax=Fundidesulfovibrio magnetotacticus TaxID=2730080 RepID=A0A6V8LMT2_9BACT|nr:tryptophan synthase subunit alpha [Fundidesulfovibrio magnetotacticus]GFK93982.1 Tryptophan synthase alpha chain [Fundidesulfovibrio magnetotacticus]
MSILTERIRSANASGRKAVIPYLPAGFPDRERFWAEVSALDAGGADVIEIGVPFSDPVADGPVVEAASLECLEHGVTLEWILAELGRRKGAFRAGIVLMGYYNPFLQYGLERLGRDCAAAGVGGLIVPDLPLEESGPLRAALAGTGTECICLVGLNTPPERLAEYARVARGFVYFVSVLGTTGVRESLPEEVLAKLAQVRPAFSVPVALGFGISRPAQVAPFGDLIDAAVVGSALIKRLREGGDGAGFMKDWREGASLG